MDLSHLINLLSRHLPPVMRWSGAVARRLRQYDIAVSGKSSGSASTDALTLADLTLQELLVAVLRDADPLFQQCRLEAEESTGDVARFARDAPYTLSIDPIDGTRQYRDRTGNGYSVLIHLRSAETVHYSLAYTPETGPQGTWVEVVDGKIVCGDDDLGRPAVDVLRTLAPVVPEQRPDSKRIYLIGFQKADTEKAKLVTAAGLEGYWPEKMPGSIYELLARGAFGGSLIHSPNVYDFPIALHIARVLGGDAVWVHSGESVHFREMWNDELADMLRLPGIIACSANRQTLQILCNLARDWNPKRYANAAD